MKIRENEIRWDDENKAAARPDSRIPSPILARDPGILTNLNRTPLLYLH